MFDANNISANLTKCVISGFLQADSKITLTPEITETNRNVICYNLPIIHKNILSLKLAEKNKNVQPRPEKRSYKRVDCKAVLFGRFRKSRSSRVEAREPHTSAFALAVWTLAQDLSFECWPSLAFAKRSAVEKTKSNEPLPVLT